MGANRDLQARLGLVHWALEAPADHVAAVIEFTNALERRRLEDGAGQAAQGQLVCTAHQGPRIEIPAGSGLYQFIWTKRDWQVVFGGGEPFFLPPILGSRYEDFLLHRPNLIISSFKLEVVIQPEKGEIRALNSIQYGSDATARRNYRRELDRLREKQAAAQAQQNPAELDRLAKEIRAYEAALRQGAGFLDTGERSRSNVRHAIKALRPYLLRQGPRAIAFLKHMDSHLSLGYDCYYRQPEGIVWE